MVRRDLEKIIFDSIVPGKVVLIFGARRVGKTVLIEQLQKRFKGKASYLNGDEITSLQMLQERTISNYRQLLKGTDLLVVDEAQNIPDIGKALKLMVDHIDGLSVLVSGSSAFDLLNKTGEPLVGRSYSFKLYPFSVRELSKNETRIETIQRLEERLIFGMYPELSAIEDYDKKQRYLTEVANAYLLKDILTVDGIKNAGKMRDLLRLIAYQAGNLVSYDELSKHIALSRNTVEKYLDLLAKTFIIYRLPSYSRNSRKEMSKTSKWYFCDNGIRNALINDFRPLSIRQDIGCLWESFLIAERIKINNNRNLSANYYFWRSYAGQEIDLIEEKNGTLQSFEFKWGTKTAKQPTAFKENYPEIPFSVVNKSNFLNFLANK